MAVVVAFARSSPPPTPKAVVVAFPPPDKVEVAFVEPVEVVVAFVESDQLAVASGAASLSSPESTSEVVSISSVKPHEAAGSSAELDSASTSSWPAVEFESNWFTSVLSS